MLLAGCTCAPFAILDPGGTVIGSGVWGDREVVLEQPATALEISGGLTVTLERGEPLVSMRGDDDLLELFEIVVEGGVLTVRARQPMRARVGLAAVVRMPALTDVTASGAIRLDAGSIEGGEVRWELSGASVLRATRLQAQRLVVNTSGSSRVEVEAGEVGSVKLSASGAGRILLPRVEVGDAEVSATGASKVLAGVVSGHTRAEASGASKVEVSGTGALEQVATGASKVVRTPDGER